MSQPNIDRTTQGGADKDTVGYRQHESCKTCANFNGRIYCSKVNGHISPDCVCSLWTLREDTVGLTGKEIIMEEYIKSQGGE